MSLIGEQVDGYVQSQIERRQALHGSKTRSDTQLNVLNNQNAWLKMGSSVKIKSGEKGEQRLKDIGLDNPANFLGLDLASQAVLFNSLSEFNGDTGYTQRSGVSTSTDLWNSNKAYGLGSTDFGITPPPGLISAEIKAKNRGSIRECNVTLKAYNKFQFELIELLYLRLGFSMLIEWGWNKYIGNDNQYHTTGPTLMETFWFNVNKDSFSNVISKIAIQRKQNNGNYDGFLGKVTNFDWKFQPDGTYDISIKLITTGDVIESLKVNLPQSTATVGEINTSIQTNISPVSTGLSNANSTIITNAGDSMLSYSLYSDVMDPNTGKWDGSDGGVKTNYLSLLGILGEEVAASTVVDPQASPQPTLPITPDTTAGVNTMKYSFFLTFRELLDKIQRHVLPSINGDKILGINTTSSQICAIYPYQFSLDPRVCFVKPFFLSRFSFNSKEQFEAGKSEGGEESTAISNYYSWLKRVNNFGIKDKKSIYGSIMDIYLNYDFITTLLADATDEKGDIYLFKFLSAICTGINDALGGINNIECILSDDREINFIEQNPIPGIENSDKYGSLYNSSPVPFELFGYNKNNASLQTSNFVRDFGFNTRISKELASSITIGATAEGIKTKNYDGTAFSKWNDGLIDRFNTDYKDPEEPALLPPPTPSGSVADLAPLTLEDVAKMTAAYDASSIDTNYGYDPLYKGAKVAKDLKQLNIGLRLLSAGVDFVGKKFTKRKIVKTTFAGAEKDGPKDVTCPITNKTYGEKSWEQYGKIVRDFKINQLEIPSDKPDDVVNFIAYCASAMGGKINTQNVAVPQYFKFDDGFIKIGKNSFKGWVNTISNKVYKKTGQPSNTIGFIPIDLNLKCDGLSGIKIYQQLAVRQEFLPKQYPRALKFVLKQVNHTISNNDWTTELNTIATANTKDTVLTAETFSVVEYDLTDKELKYATQTFAAGTAGAIMGGTGAVLGSGIPVGVDPRDIINPNEEGSRRYSYAPLAKYLNEKGVQNGINEQIVPYLVDTGEPCQGKFAPLCKNYNAGLTNWHLAQAPAGAYKRWKEDALASGYNIGITNGYRSAAYQAKIGGVKGSAHGFGGAIDLFIKEKTSGKLRHVYPNRVDYQKVKFKYSGKKGPGAFADRITEDWKIVAMIGAKYGFFNPYRLADKPTVDAVTDEAWHFEYWGDPANPNFLSGITFATGGATGPVEAKGSPKEIEYFNTIKGLHKDIKLIFDLDDTFGPGGKPLFQPAKGKAEDLYNDDEGRAYTLFSAWLNSESVKKRTWSIQGKDKKAFWDWLGEIRRKMKGNSANDWATFKTTVGGVEKFTINTDF
tara:strand:+ start:700 stop:4632 length:3933 start_codon:yes stop_codon:yes gene_type:complete